MLLAFAPEKFKDDVDIANLALEQNSQAYLSVSSNLKKDLNIMDKSIDNILSFDKNDVTDSMLIKAVVNSPYAIRHFKYKTGDVNFVKLLARSNGMSLKYLPDKMKDDYGVVEEAIKSNPKSFQYASDRLRKDGDLIDMILAVDPGYFIYCDMSEC